MNIPGKTALVTGGAHRVGKGITLGLAAAGANVVINYYSSGEAAPQPTREAEALGVEALAVQCDVADADAVHNMAAQIEARFGGVDILVNAADNFAQTPFPSNALAREGADARESWRRVTGVTVDGPYYVTNALAPGMIERAKASGESAAVVNILDLIVWRPWPNFLAHAASKGALDAMTRQMALELAPHVRVNAVAPGSVLPPDHFSEEQIERFAQRALLKRWGTPADVAHAVCYLVEADYVTGAVLTVDGGERITYTHQGQR